MGMLEPRLRSTAQQKQFETSNWKGKRSISRTYLRGDLSVTVA